jgi:hypothetical protein
VVRLYVLLRPSACNWLTSLLLACPIINMYSVGDELNRICYSRWHCCILLGQPGGHGKSKIKYTNLIVKMDRLPDPPVDGNNDCQKA